jgi:hypothetical protein
MLQRNKRLKVSEIRFLRATGYRLLDEKYNAIIHELIPTTVGYKTNDTDMSLQCIKRSSADVVKSKKQSRYMPWRRFGERSIAPTHSRPPH